MPRNHQSNRMYIYVLIDPCTLEVMYVGKTRCPAKRFDAHVSIAINARYTGPKGQWIKSLSDRGLRPIMDILASCSIEESENYEYRYYKLFNYANNLLNTATIQKETFQLTLTF